MILWKNLAATIEEQINAGMWKPGDTMPTEAALAREYGVSRNTVRHALEHLELRGLVRGEGTAGRTVADRVLLDIHVTRPASRVSGEQRATAGADSWRADVEALGHKARVRLYVGATAAGEMAGRLDLEPGDQVIVREQLRLAGGRPHNWVEWYFPRSLAAGTKLAHPDDIAEGSIPYLGGIGHGPHSYTVEIETRMPGLGEQGRLGIPHGVPVMIEYRTGFGPSGRPVFCSVTVWPGDRTRLVLDL